MLSGGMDRKVQGPRLMEDVYYNFYHSTNQTDMEEEEEKDTFEWNSDNENTLDTRDGVRKHYNGGLEFLGFYPFKEVIFLQSIEHWPIISIAQRLKIWVASTQNITFPWVVSYTKLFHTHLVGLASYQAAFSLTVCKDFYQDVMQILSFFTFFYLEICISLP
jgi:hypothetical protein